MHWHRDEVVQFLTIINCICNVKAMIGFCDIVPIRNLCFFLSKQKKNISTDFSIWPIHETFWAYLNRKSSCLADCRNEKLFLFASTHMYKYIISANTNIQHVTTSHDTFKELTYKKKSILWSINISRFMYDLAMVFFPLNGFCSAWKFRAISLDIINHSNGIAKIKRHWI